ncbi:hypothetical protein DFH06DRAFT_1000691, partial [Mycena polygramma]
ENLADAVWKTVELYGLQGRIISFVMDNASNNDTMTQHFQQKCEEEGIEFDAEEARIRCMPHTAHLAALKLLEAIGVINKADKKKAEGRAAAYQDAVSAPLAREYDDDAEFDDEEGEDAEDGPGRGVQKLKAVTKLRQIIRLIRASPQRRQAWVHEVRVSSAFTAGKLGKVPLMLILDVKTRWSSTHQMLRAHFPPSNQTFTHSPGRQEGPLITVKLSTISSESTATCIISISRPSIGTQSHWLRDGSSLSALRRRSCPRPSARFSPSPMQSSVAFRMIFAPPSGSFRLQRPLHFVMV